MTPSHYEYMCRVVESLPHCKKLGLQLTSLEQGKGTASLNPRPEFVGNVAKQLLHSAIATTLLDTLCGTVASSAYPEGRTVATLDLRIDHLRELQAHLPLYARAECFHTNKDVAYVRGWAWQEDEETVVASATGTFMTNGTFQLQPEGMK